MTLLLILCWWASVSFAFTFGLWFGAKRRDDDVREVVVLFEQVNERHAKARECVN